MADEIDLTKIEKELTLQNDMKIFGNLKIDYHGGLIMNLEDIKYKAWHKKEKKMYTVVRMDLEQNEIRVKDEKDFYNVINNVPENSDNLSKDVVLLPFTGFKDKNGTEIYEGDILKQGKSMLQIIYNDNLKQMRMIPLKSSFPDKYKLEDYEIIGNVWENPELLKESTE